MTFLAFRRNKALSDRPSVRCKRSDGLLWLSRRAVPPKNCRIIASADRWNSHLQRCSDELFRFYRGVPVQRNPPPTSSGGCLGGTLETEDRAKNRFRKIRTRPCQTYQNRDSQQVSRLFRSTDMSVNFRHSHPLSGALKSIFSVQYELGLEGILEAARACAQPGRRLPSGGDPAGTLVAEALETQAARLFAKLATPRERTELKKLAAGVDALARKADRLHYLQLHERLHRRIAVRAMPCPVSRDRANAFSGINVALRPGRGEAGKARSSP